MNARILLTSLVLACAMSFASTATAQKSAVRYGGRATPSISGAAYRRSSIQSSHGDSRYGRARHRSEVRHSARRTWIPGRYVTSHRRVWIPERHGRVWVDPVYGWSFDACGIRIRIVTHAGYWDDVHHAGTYEHHPVRTWNPGYWSYR